jgi:predicted dehydrogenase
MNQAIHNVDLLLWLMGSVRRVMGATATLAHRGIEVEDTAVACLQFASGALGVIQAATSVYPGLPKMIAIHGDAGSVVVEQDDILKWEFERPLPEDAAIRARFAAKVNASGGASDPAAISHVGHTRQLTDFVQAIRSQSAPLVDGGEGRRAVELIRAIYDSAENARPINLPAW